MAFPLTLDEYLFAVAKETARMSWPGRMSAILEKDAKNDVEIYFTSDIFRAELASIWARTVSDYSLWHGERAAELAKWIAKRVKTSYRPEAVAAKLMDTFMHQLVKYPKCQFLWADLHLVLDNRVFAALRALAPGSIALQTVRSILNQNPYKISTEQYKSVQRQVRKFVVELNHRRDMEFELTSPIQLNLLWADGHRNESRTNCR